MTGAPDEHDALPAAPEPGPDADTGSDWQRLDRRTVYARLIGALGSLVPIAAAVLFFGSEMNQSFMLAIGVVAITALITAGRDLVRTLTTRYRLGPDRIEVRSGLFVRRIESAARDRIRSVDQTAKPLHRIFSLVVVKIGTGRQAAGQVSGAELVLDAVSVQQGTFLHDELLRRSPAPALAVEASAEDQPAEATDATAEPGGRILATLDPRWVWFDLLTVWVLLLPGIAIGGIYGALNTVGLQTEDVAFATDFLSRMAVLVAIAIVVGLLLLVGIVTGAALFFENWGNLRVERGPEGNLRIRRGLLTTRTIQLEGDRIRGVRLLAPLLLRGAGGARPQVLTTGVSEDSEVIAESTRALLPSVPLARAEQIAADALGETESPVSEKNLQAHPSAARNRRLVRAAWGTAFVVAVAVAFAATDTVAPLAVAIPAVAIALVFFGLALGGHAGLGSGVTPGYFVVREGVIRRRTVALKREGVIGVCIRTTWFQRRRGLASLYATTAATGGAYRALDITEPRAIELANAVLPETVGPMIDGPPPNPS